VTVAGLGALVLGAVAARRAGAGRAGRTLPRGRAAGQLFEAVRQPAQQALRGAARQAGLL
jgi:hypothetical protein